jgi:hypothetical protein
MRLALISLRRALKITSRPRFKANQGSASPASPWKIIAAPARD